MPEKKKSASARKWRPAPQENVTLFDRIASSFPNAEKRKMFGYPCSFADGNMFSGLFQEDFFLRLGEEDRTAFLELKGAERFSPISGRVMSEYVVLPRSMLSREIELRGWFVRAYGYALSLPPKKAGEKKRK